jgi:hypothetical protein
MAVIPIADVITTERLPIDAQDIVTKVRLVIAGNRAGADPDRLVCRAADDVDVGTPVDYLAWPITFEYEAPEHAAYRAERSFALPEGVDPFLPPTDTGIPEPVLLNNFTNPGDPSAIRDGDPATFAEFTGTTSSNNSVIFYPHIVGAYGFRIRYELTTARPASSNGIFYDVNIVVVANPAADYDRAAYALAHIDLRDTVGDPAEAYMVLPPLAHLAPENGPVAPVGDITGLVRLGFFVGVESCRIYAFYPLVLNEPLLEDIAKANVRLPAQNPTRVTVTGVVPPDREHTITGWPGGDFTAPVAQQQYELGRTIIDFEQAGAPTGLPAEAVEAARERTTAVKAEVARAGYSVKMGERQ